MSDQQSLSWRRYAVIAGLFAVVALITYGTIFRNAFVTWDDTLLIVQNENVHSLTPHSVRAAFTSYDPELYIPLTFLSYQFDWLLGGGSALPFRITSLALHTVNALLVTWLIFELLGSGWIALVCGLLFLVHPLNTEAVAWAAGRKDLLSGFFFLSALLAYIRHRRTDKHRLYWLSLAFFLCALLSKVIAITLPVVLLVLIAGRERLEKESALRTVPFFLLSVVFGIVALFGKTAILAQTTITEKILMAFKSTVFYLTAFLWPVHLSPVYPYTGTVTITSADFFVPVLIVLLLAAGIAASLKFTRVLAVAGALFLVTLAPTFLNFAKAGDMYVASDRYAYIPMIWLLLLAGIASHWLLERATYAKRATYIGVIGAAWAIVITASAFAARAQVAVWRDSRTLYEHILAYYPQSRAAHTNLGMEYLEARFIDEAIEEFRASLQLKEDPYTRTNLASAYLKKGATEDAIREYEAVLALSPGIADAYYGLGTIAQQRGNIAEATEYYRKALEKDPDHAQAYNNLGGILMEKKDWRQAAEAFRTAVRINPHFASAFYNLGIAQERSGNMTEAIDAYEHALALMPSDGSLLANLAWAYYKQNRIQDAGQTVERALMMDPKNVVALDLVRTMKQEGKAK